MKHLSPAYVWIQFYGITSLHLMFHLNWNSFLCYLSFSFVRRRPNTMNMRFTRLSRELPFFFSPKAIIFCQTKRLTMLTRTESCVDEILVHPKCYLTFKIWFSYTFVVLPCSASEFSGRKLSACTLIPFVGLFYRFCTWVKSI